MNIIDIIKFLFKKFNITREQLNQWINNFLKIPKFLKICVLVSAALYGIYYGYQISYQREIDVIKNELNDLNKVLDYRVNTDDYSNDIYYLVMAIKTVEAIQQYAYQEEQLQLKLIRRHIVKYFPTDPIINDIDAMIERNDYNYEVYNKNFYKYLHQCKNIYLNNDNEKSENEGNEGK